MRILAIDPGLVNVGWAIIDDGKLKTFGVFNMAHKVQPKRRKEYAYMVRRFMNFKMFRTCDVIVVERQMSGKLRVVANSFVCFNWNKAVLVHPRSVRNHHKISMSDYRANKRASVARAPKYMTKKQTTRFRASSKRDDMADAILIGMYWHESNSKLKTYEENIFELSDDDVWVSSDDESSKKDVNVKFEVDVSMQQLNAHFC